METYNLAAITKKIYDSDFNLFTLKTLQDILEIEKESSFYSILKRLLQNEVLLKIERGKYLLKNAKINDFSLANFVYNPSYISFESALNFYGILSQFPKEVTNATFKKTKEKIIGERVFSFTHIKKDLFWGYEKKEDFLIAFPEKALLDQLYLSSKGLRSISLDEYDFSNLNIERIEKFINKFPRTKQFIKAVKDLKKIKKI